MSVHADGSFTYTPDATNPATGIDSFDYYIQDPAGGWDLATANVTVNAVIRDDSYSTPAGRTLSVKAPGVLANDLGYDRGSLSGDTTSAHGGDVTVNDDGSFQYTPPAGFQGTDTFTYTVSDTNDDNSYTATAHIGVASPAPPATQVVAPNSTTSTTVGPGGATAPGQHATRRREGPARPGPRRPAARHSRQGRRPHHDDPARPVPPRTAPPNPRAAQRRERHRTRGRGGAGVARRIFERGARGHRHRARDRGGARRRLVVVAAAPPRPARAPSVAITPRGTIFAVHPAVIVGVRAVSRD